jgi:hypothetical protein
MNAPDFPAFRARIARDHTIARLEQAMVWAARAPENAGKLRHAATLAQPLSRLSVKLFKFEGWPDPNKP